MIVLIVHTVLKFQKSSHFLLPHCFCQREKISSYKQNQWTQTLGGLGYVLEGGEGQREVNGEKGDIRNM